MHFLFGFLAGVTLGYIVVEGFVRVMASRYRELYHFK